MKTIKCETKIGVVGKKHSMKQVYPQVTFSFHTSQSLLVSNLGRLPRNWRKWTGEASDLGTLVTAEKRKSCIAIKQKCSVKLNAENSGNFSHILWLRMLVPTFTYPTYETGGSIYGNVEKPNKTDFYKMVYRSFPSKCMGPHLPISSFYKEIH